MADRMLGDSVVMGLHLDIAIQCMQNARDCLERNKYGEAKHELTKALLDAEEARVLFKKLTTKNM